MGRSCTGRWGVSSTRWCCRADLAGEPSTRELLRRTRAAAQASAHHQHVPFDAIVKELRPERSPSHPPLVQVLLAVRAAAADAAGGVAADPGLTSHADVQVRPVPGGGRAADGLTGRFVYDSDLFEPETIKRMAGHWRMVLEGMVAAPSRPVSRAGAAGADGDRAAAARPWSTGGEVPPGPDVAALIEQQAGPAPDAVAVICAGRAADLPASWTGGPTSWRSTCGSTAWRRRYRSGCAWSGHWSM